MNGTGTPPRPGRWLRVVLFVSLAFNLLVVGAVAGFVLYGPPPPHGDRSDPVLPYTRAFDEDQRRDVRRALRRSFVNGGARMRDGYLADYETALELLRAEPFQEDRIRALLSAQAARGGEVRKRGQEVLTDYLAGLSPEARRAYADRLEAEVEKMRQRGFRRHGDDGRPLRDRD